MTTEKRPTGVMHFFTELSVLQSLLLTVVAILFPSLRTVGFFSQFTSLSFDGLLLYQGCFAILATLSAFVILYLIGRLASSDKACSSIMKYTYYFITLVMIFSFSICLKEFYAPTSSFTKYFVGEELSVNYALVQEESGMEYEVETCSISGFLVKCTINLSNKTEDDFNVKRFDLISMYDQDNHKGKLEKVIFDNRVVRRSDSIHLTKKSSATLIAYFQMSNKSKSEIIKKLRLNLQYFGDFREVIFRNIELDQPV